MMRPRFRKEKRAMLVLGVLAVGTIITFGVIAIMDFNVVG